MTVRIKIKKWMDMRRGIIFVLVAQQLDLNFSYFYSLQGEDYQNKYKKMGCIKSCFRPQTPLQIEDQVHSENNLITAVPQDKFIVYSYQQIRDHVFTSQESQAIRKDLRVADERLKYKCYRDALNNSLVNADVSVKKILQNLYSKFRNLRLQTNLEARSDLYLDRPEINKIVPPENIIKYFIFFFTADQVYRKYLDKQVRKSKFDQIAQIVKILRPHIAQQLNTQLKNKLLEQSNFFIYKAYPRTSDQTMQDFYKMQSRKINYFPSFFFAELKENASRTNAWLTIKVDASIEHQYLAIKPPYCKYGQNKLIVFPFFCYQKQQEKENELVHTKNNSKINVKLRQVLPKK